MNATENQVIALAALFQHVQAVDQLARTGHCPTQLIETAVRSILCTQPDNVLEVYGSLENLHEGRNVLGQIINTQAKAPNQLPIRYALAAIQLESRLHKDADMLSKLARGIDLISHKVQHFGADHANVTEAVAQLYLDTLSTYKNRIQISGMPNHLQNPAVAARIRSLLLAAIRAAMLWRQVGGRRWHLIFKRKALGQALTGLGKV